MKCVLTEYDSIKNYKYSLIRILFLCLEAAEKGVYDVVAENDGFGVDKADWKSTMENIIRILEGGVCEEGGKACRNCKEVLIICLKTEFRRWEAESDYQAENLEKEERLFNAEIQEEKIEALKCENKQLLTELAEGKGREEGYKDEIVGLKSYLGEIEQRLRLLQGKEKRKILMGKIDMDGDFENGEMEKGEEELEGEKNGRKDGRKDGRSEGGDDSFSSSGKRRPSWLTDGYTERLTAGKRRKIVKSIERSAVQSRHILESVGGALRSVSQRVNLTEAASGALYADPVCEGADNGRFWQRSHFFKEDLKLSYEADYTLSLRVKTGGAQIERGRMECRNCVTAHGMGGAPRWFLCGDGSLPCMVGAAQCAATSCMVTVRLADGTEEDFVGFFKALRDNASRDWRRPQRGSVIAFQSLTMLFGSASPDAYLERLERLRIRLAKEVWGVGEEGEPNIELVPILFPYFPKNDREASIYGEYVETMALLKQRGTIPVVSGPICKTFDFLEGAPLRTISVRPWKKKIVSWGTSEKKEAIGVLNEMQSFFSSQKSATGEKLGGGEGGSNDWCEEKRWNDRRGRTKQFHSIFGIDKVRADKLCLEKVKHLIEGGEGEEGAGPDKLGVGGLLQFNEQYVFEDASWAFGIPIQLLEDWCYALSTELQEVADSLGRRGVLAVSQISMVSGVGKVFGARNGKCRREGLPCDPPPSRWRELDAEAGTVGPSPPQVIKEIKHDAILLLGSSIYRNIDPMISGFRTFSTALPGLDLAKEGEGEKVVEGVKKLLEQAEDYWEGEDKKVKAIVLGIFGNAALKGEKKEGKWGLASDAFNKSVIMKRNNVCELELTYIVEQIGKINLGAKIVLIPAIPRFPELFASEGECFNHFQKGEKRLAGFAEEMDLEISTFMETLDPSANPGGIKKMLGTDSIHLNEYGKETLVNIILGHFD